MLSYRINIECPMFKLFLLIKNNIIKMSIDIDNYPPIVIDTGSY